MKLQFKNQGFQTDAVNAVCDLFAGQEKMRSTFAIQGSDQLHLFENEHGIGNKLIIDDNALLTNMNAVQKRHNLPTTAELEGRQFCVEMETGTGKTYVYTKTILELNKRYGFTKFIIVVPSVAIREGVYKSFQITAEHFANQYDNVPCRYFVSSNQTANDFNKPYIRLLSVSNDKGFRAKLEIDVQNGGKVTRKPIIVKPDADLYLLSGERDLYDGYTVSGIDCTPGVECVEFSNTEVVKLGNAIGSVDENIIKRAQIRRTIEAHFTKELMYFDKGIKVLSLFFIDEVGKYRRLDGGKGIYAQMFEECYNELLDLPKYAALRGKFQTDVNATHDGYFSQDKKGNYKNTKSDTIADYDTYNTIMKDKEWLLSFECPLRFIFSHSTLKEGWDNPNVFQVCTLIDQKSAFTCRQKVGRGLRLCVNQNGDRIEDKDINVLHVMANESFAEFADTLQKEIEQETGVKFGYMDISLFSGMVYSRDASRDVTVRINKQVMVSPEFLELWDKIKQKTSYRVQVDTEELIRGCVKDIAGMEAIPKTRIISQTADIHIDRAGVSHSERDYRTSELKSHYSVLPNIVGILSERCLITRRTANTILRESGRLRDFINNPQLFIECVTEIINNRRHQLAIDGIRYIKLDGEEYSVMEIFDSAELIANLDRNAVAVQRSVYDYVIYDSETIEKPFALALDGDPNVKMYFKIPPRFKIETPIGTYNPDWAVYFEKDGVKKLYFVLETKGNASLFDLRTPEKLKIHCGRQHFKALNAGIEYHVTTDWDKYKLSI